MRTFLKRLVLPATAGLLLAVPAAQAGGPFGIGIQVGEPTGVSAKYYLSGNNALQGVVAWSFSDEANLHLQLDYLYHFVAVFDDGDGGTDIPWYIGVGGRYKARDDIDSQIGVRVPVGLDFRFAERFDFYVEIAPVLDLAPDTDFTFNGGLGVRIFF